MQAITYDPGDPGFRTDPWSLYQRLREEAPAYHGTPVTADAEDFYVLSRYDDVALALRDGKVFSSHIRRGDYLDLPIMVNRDAPDHTRLRRITNRAFGPRVLGPLTEWMTGVIEDLVAELLSMPEAEYVEQFSTVLPLRVVGAMLGAPLDRKADIQRGGEAVLELIALVTGTDPDVVPGCYEDYMALVGFIDGEITERVGCPHRGDILSDLATRETAGELTHDEAVGLGWSFIAAGQTTTINLLTGGMHMLLSDPSLAERLIADPGKTEDFMEEYLRLYSPTQVVYRRLEHDLELHGVTMPAGASIQVLLGAANRDPRMFPDPDVFDMDRPNVSEHLAFGAGAHFCPGTVLGRVMAGIAYRKLYPHLSRFSLDPARPAEMRSRPGAFGIHHMGVLVSQGTPAHASV